MIALAISGPALVFFVIVFGLTYLTQWLLYKMGFDV